MKVLEWFPGTDYNFDAMNGLRPDVCAGCGRVIDGDPLIYEGETWHPACFKDHLEELEDE